MCIRDSDYRVHGVAYEFMRFDNVYAMGGMEYIMDMKTYRTTLRTVTRCTVVKMSRANFEKWMSADIHALKQEAKQVANYLLEEGRKGRTLLFLQGADRLSMLLVERFERYAKNGLLQVRGGQQGLSLSLIHIFPYIISLIVLIFVSKKSRAPKAEGIPYDKGQR